MAGSPDAFFFFEKASRRLAHGFAPLLSVTGV
jgi:hypothetical protein